MNVEQNQFRAPSLKTVLIGAATFILGIVVESKWNLSASAVKGYNAAKAKALPEKNDNGGE